MADFEKIHRNVAYYKKCNWYTMDGELTSKDIEDINKLTSETIISIPNTKGISSEMLRKITNPKVKFSVRGGLDYLKKSKFNEQHYIERTIHSPNNLSSIISKFEKIERKIRYSWNENQKCMFVYKMLVEELHYKYKHESDYENGRDVVRSLEGLLYDKLVCSGFAIVLKEALDRLGIENEYQNRRNHHSWNIAKIDGKYRALDLTWDCCNKTQDGKCGFIFYNQDRNFYGNEHHDISGEPEEYKYPIVPYDIETLKNDYKGIVDSTLEKSYEMQKSKDGRFDYVSVQQKDGINEYVININGSLICVYMDSDLDASENLTFNNVKNALISKNAYIGKKKIDKSKFSKKNYYRRRDGNEFFIIPHGKKDDIYESFLVEPTYENGKMVLKRYAILSENDLANCNNESTKSVIANQLLSKERVRRKMEHFNGYVGYVSGMNMYYDKDFEQRELNIMDRH